MNSRPLLVGAVLAGLLLASCSTNRQQNLSEFLTEDEIAEQLTVDVAGGQSPNAIWLGDTELLLSVRDRNVGLDYPLGLLPERYRADLDLNNPFPRVRQSALDASGARNFTASVGYGLVAGVLPREMLPQLLPDVPVSFSGPTTSAAGTLDGYSTGAVAALDEAIGSHRDDGCIQQLGADHPWLAVQSRMSELRASQRFQEFMAGQHAVETVDLWADCMASLGYDFDSPAQAYQAAEGIAAGLPDSGADAAMRSALAAEIELATHDQWDCLGYELRQDYQRSIQQWESTFVSANLDEFLEG